MLKVNEIQRKESKVNEIYVNTNTLKENQIKGEKPLTDLAETVNFLQKGFMNLKSIRISKKKQLIVYIVRYQFFIMVFKKMQAQADK